MAEYDLNMTDLVLTHLDHNWVPISSSDAVWPKCLKVAIFWEIGHFGLVSLVWLG